MLELQIYQNLLELYLGVANITVSYYFLVYYFYHAI